MADDSRKRQVDDKDIINMDTLVYEYAAQVNTSNVNTDANIDTNTKSNTENTTYRIEANLSSNLLDLEDLEQNINDTTSPYRSTINQIQKNIEELENLVKTNKDDADEKHIVLEYYVINQVYTINNTLFKEKAKNKKYRILLFCMINIYAIIILLLLFLYK